MPRQQRLHVRVHYPPRGDRIVLRTEEDWERDVTAFSTSNDGGCHEFLLHTTRPFVYFKPVLVAREKQRWSVGSNFLAVGDHAAPMDVYPRFFEDEHCSACERKELVDEQSGHRHAYRVFYPPGYRENVLQRYPVLYMQDGQNLFFPGEAFQGEHWRVAETLGVLDNMNAIRPVIVVGIYPNQREFDYTSPGFHDYGRFVAETLKPVIDAEYRTLAGPTSTAVMGSSLGGVVSFYLAWQFPRIFGMAACMSSTFGWRDDLVDRVAAESRRPCVFYLDSGWPADNYEATRNMRNVMLRRGYQEGLDLHYLAFPEARHDERHWALRAHIPFQLFFGDGRDRTATPGFTDIPALNSAPHTAKRSISGVS